METKRRLTIYLLLILGMALALPLVAMQPAGSYPPAGTGFTGWTAEATAPNAYYGYHAQLAKGDSYMYMIAEAPGNGGVNLWKASDTNTLNWAYAGLMDTSEPTYAADPYIDAEGTYVAASWKEHNGSTWGLVVAVSSDWGASWTKWVDSNPGWSNYEAHVTIEGGKVHCAYVSDYGGRNEVYYRRFDLALNMEHLSCASNNTDGVAASLPCIESCGASFANVYYQHGNSSPHPIYESWTNNGGSSWNITPDIIPTGGGLDFSWPEVAVFWAGGDRRKMVVADGRNITTGFHFIYYNRYYNTGWQGSTLLCDLGTEPSYPQISSREDDLLVVYRGSGGSTGNEGQGRINPNSGEGTWSFIDNLFYDQVPYNGCGAVDCCSDGSRFYASSCSWGSNILVLTKREDSTNPTVSITNPGMYHSGDFTVAASAWDDFYRSDTWMLGPYVDPNDDYDLGIMYADFSWRMNGGSWNAFPGGGRDDDGGWELNFATGGLPDGTYDFWVRVYDTAERYNDAYFNGVIIDRQAPTSSPYTSGGTLGLNGWYTAAPSIGCNNTDNGTPPSGVDAQQYRIDSGSWMAYGSPFAASEGAHSYFFRCSDRAGNWSSSGGVQLNVNLDSQKPDADRSIPAADGENGWRITQAAATVTLSGTDPAGGSGFHSLQFAWDGPPSTAYSTPLVAPEGTHTLYYRALDVAGNWSDTESLEMKADYTNPGSGLQISDPNGAGGWFMEQPAVGPTVTGDDGSGSGVFQCYYRFDGAGDWNVYTNPFPLLEGDHTFNYYCRDWAGRNSAEGSYSYKADLTNPSGSIVTPTNGSYITTTLSMVVDAQDALSGVGRAEFYYEGSNFGFDDTSPYSKTTNVSSSVDGQKEIRGRIYDQAGRWAWTEQAMVKKDTTPPEVEITEPTGEHWIRGMVTVKASPNDNMEVARVDFYLDGVLFDSRTSYPWMGSLDTTCWMNDYHTISVKAYDGAGNASADGGLAQVEAFIGNNISETNNFAEGCTRQGFDTWLCLQNPGDEEAQVTVNYMLGPGQGMAGARNYAVPPHSRMTVNVNSDVGADKDVSMQVTSSSPIVSERPMYFDYQGLASHSWKGGHTAQGVSVPGQEWYLAEGCTRGGFEEWICIQNPGDVGANVRIDYMLGDGRVITRHYGISPWQRFTVSVNQDIGPNQDVSAKVTSDSPIVVERPMYFLYQGAWDGGHNTMAVPTPATEWYFAEGCTRAGFNQWLCIQNPGDQAANIEVTYMTENGTEIKKGASIPPHSRHTINVNVDVAREHDVSTKVLSDNPIIVERPMYFWYSNLGFDEGSCAVGSNKACSTWYLAEGCTRKGFEEWICLQNPGDETATVVLTYMLENGQNSEQTVTVAPHSRQTLRVNDKVGPDHDVSTQVMSDKPVIVERPMYALYRGVWPSADSLNAYTFEK